MRSIIHTVNIFTMTSVVSQITVKLQSQSVGSKSTNSMQEHLGQKAKLFNFCSTPKAKGAGAIVFSVRLSRSRTKRLVEIARHLFNSVGPVRLAYAIASIVGVLRTKYLPAKVVSHVTDLIQRLLSKQARTKEQL